MSRVEINSFITLDITNAWRYYGCDDKELC